jgi:hypothetical protein
MILVMGLLAVAATLSWALLSSSSMHAAVNVNAVRQAQNKNLAESGASLALYYLRYPEKWSGGNVTGTHGNVHYPGQTDLLLWDDETQSVDINVVNIAADTFRIESVAGESRVVAEAKIKYSGYEVSDGAAFNRGLTIPANVTIDGTVSALGTISNAANITGTATRVTAAPVADASAVRILQETLQTPTNPVGSSRRTYTWNGQEYQAQKLPFIVVGTLTPDASNPAGVWYADTGQSLAIGDATIQGTIVNHSTTWDLRLSGTVNITPHAGMPALVTAGDLDICTSIFGPTRATVNGLVWVGGQVQDTGLRRTDGFFKINGALQVANTSNTFNSNIRLPVQIKYEQANLAVPEFLTTTSRQVSGIRLNSWTAQ